MIGEGSRRDALEAQARELRIAHRVVFTGRRDDVPAVTAALDVAVLPSYREAQGLSILEAMALARPGRRLERRRDPRNDRGRRDRPARRAARRRGAGRGDHPAADATTRTPTRSRRAGHDLVHDRFCIELMVDAVEAIYEEGARSVRVPAAVAG